ncbi:MAG: YdcH family protein [bacterium]|nr:YdcH family protein [bacterium]
MSLNAHIDELAEKHRDLDRRIEKEASSPGSDDVNIHELKKEKLRLKDEMERLRTTASAVE